MFKNYRPEFSVPPLPEICLTEIHSIRERYTEIKSVSRNEVPRFLQKKNEKELND